MSVTSRNTVSQFLTGKQLGSRFHNLFQIDTDKQRKQDKKPKKKSKKSKDKVNSQRNDKANEIAELQNPPLIELYDNASAFNVFSHVRKLVLEHENKKASQIYSQSVYNKGGDEDSGDELENNKDASVKLPKIVGLGVCGVFELIRETRNTHPPLCIRALQALLDMLQGQTPEGLKNEPAEAIDSLYSLLMELAVSSSCDTSQERDSLTSLACACLASLVVARGDTGKYMQAMSALLMSPSSLITQPVKVPHILTSLQKSVHAVLLGKTVLPDWLNFGIKNDAKTLSIKLPKTERGDGQFSAVASDGSFLYVHNSTGLHKVGTGYGGTIRGYISASNPAFHTKEQGWLAYAQKKLFYRSLNSVSNTLYVVDRETLQEVTGFEIEGEGYGPNVMFSDGETIGHIASSKDDSFLVRTFSPVANPMPLVNEIPLKLARKCLEVFGTASFDPEVEIHAVQTGVEEDSVQVSAGKDFALIRTATGKVLYTGRYQSLGIKQGGPAQGKWAELAITKSPKIISVSVGHEAQHALLLADDGSVFFVGTARKGEDGDTNSSAKNRRQPKPVKPKKIAKLEGKAVSQIAANSGTSAMVTRDGQLYMYGKDTTYCDSHSGLMGELKDVTVQSIVLGKAYGVVLTSKGQIYTFGVNNKGQCGRDFAQSSSSAHIASTNVTMVDEEEEAADDDSCPPGKHKWRHDHCMICTSCGECTGYGATCVNSGIGNRSPGQPCGCGSGDSGCRECGSCRSCAGELGENNDSGDEGGLLDMFAKSREVIPLDLIIGRGARNLDQLSKKLEERRVKLKALNSKSRHKGDVLEPDHVKASSLPPGRVTVGEQDLAVIQIACGLQHTVLLCENGQVFTFGSNHYGQLGQGDTSIRGAPCLVSLKSSVVQVAAGSNHTVLLTHTGQVFTFGNYKEGQLGRPPPDEELVKDKRELWYASPKLIPNIGSKHGRRATAVFASGNQTFLKIDELLINAHTLSRSNIVANQSCIGLVPMSESGLSMKCLMISRSDGSCKIFTDDDQASLYNQSLCIDPLYDLLWSYSPMKGVISAYSVLKPDMRNLRDAKPRLCDLTSAESMVPVNPGAVSTHSHLALHMLACLDTLTAAQELGICVSEHEKEKLPAAKVYTKEDFSTVNRFETHGGGWGYSGHSIEAIRFMADCDILLGGFGLFGGRGEYFGKIKVFELGGEGDDSEPDGELLAETDEMPYECGAREKYAALFEQPVPLQANRYYLAWARISGPSSDCGSSGQSTVTTEDQVVFKFKNSRKSNNGTDVNAGQLPQLLYRLPSQETSASIHKTEHVEPAHVLSRDFSRSVSPECFDSLLKLLNWSWNTFCAALHDTRDLRGTSLTAAMLDLDRLVYISTACLRLINVFINEVYPNQGTGKKTAQESYRLAECIGDTQALLKKILVDSYRQISIQPATNIDFQANHLDSPTHQPVISPSSQPIFEDKLDNVPAESQFSAMARSIIEECHQTFVASFHAFYPTTHLKWNCLCELLNLLEPYEHNVEGLSCLLAAVIEALCHPTVKLSALMPINYKHDTEHILQSQISCDDNSGIGLSGGVAVQYPVLVSHMMERAVISDSRYANNWSFRDMLDKLLSIVALPVKQALKKEAAIYPAQLVSNTCCLLAAVISELSAAVTGCDTDLLPPTRPLLSTPNRFTRTSRSAYWNTGNGTPDAVCFTVDRPGVLIAGVALYGGGGEYEFTVELLDEQAEGGASVEPSPSSRWSVVQAVSGTYGPDDCMNDIAEIKFDKPVPIKENVRYAIKLRNQGGPHTLNGDGGMTKVKCADGTSFNFSGCSLSANGTNHTRGQIPHILYYSTPQDGETHIQNSRALAEYQAGKNVMIVASSVIRVATDLLHRAQGNTDDGMMAELGNAEIFRTLLPLIMAYLGPVVSLDPKSAVQTLSLIQEVLPPMAQINSDNVPAQIPVPSPSNTLNNSKLSVNNGNGNIELPSNGNLLDFSSPSNQQDISGSSSSYGSLGGMNGNGMYAEGNTTSQHYAVIESDHPYKPATIANYKVTFPKQVKWIVLEFDPLCKTAQIEDSLQLYIPACRQDKSFKWVRLDQQNCEGTSSWWPVLKRFHGSNNWPKNAVILPGHEVCFSLETATNYVKEAKDDKTSTFGFRCLVVGYEWANNVTEGIAHIEKEMAYLGGMCAASLMRRDITLPITSMDDGDEDFAAIDEAAQQVFTMHSQLLSKGFALSQPITISQALEGNLPFSCVSNERTFLKDFVNCTPGTSGGRLAAWLQPESYLDYKQCELVYSREELKCNWPATLLLQTKDQYGKLVNVPNLKVEVKAMPVIKDTMERKKRSSRVDADSNLVFGGHPPPKLDTNYQVTYKDKKDAFHAISMMKQYENYSFEELRYAAPIMRRPSENMLVRAHNDGTYSCSWTPSVSGLYNIHITLDGYEVNELFKVEVRDAPHGVAPPSQYKDKKPPNVPNKMRKFVGKWSAGLRIRVHPSLQSEQVGIIKPQGIISFIDEIHNDDGVWLRLDQESIAKWSSPVNGYHTEAWALQYNQHLGKTLLVPVEEPKSIIDELIKESLLRRLPELIGDRSEAEYKGGPGVYTVVKCGASGHNVRGSASLKAAAVGMLHRGAMVTAVLDVANSDGTWIRLDDDSKEQFCHDQEGECWALARDADGVVYLRHEASESSDDGLPSPQPGFDFSSAQQTPQPAFAAFGQQQDPGASGEPSAFTKTGVLQFGGEPKTRLRSLREKRHPASRSRGSSRESSPHNRSSPRPGSSGRPASPLVVALGGGPGGPGARTPERRRSVEGLRGELENISGDIPPELQGVSVKELIKALGNFKLEKELSKYSAELSAEKKADLAADIKRISVKDIIRVIGESRVNGNGVTPPRTPPGTPKKSMSRSGSPKPASLGGIVSKSPRSSPLIGRREIPGAGSSGIPRPSSPRSTPPVTPPPTTPPVSGGVASDGSKEFMTPPQTPPRRASPRFDSPPSPQRSLSSSPKRTNSPLVFARSSSSSPHRTGTSASPTPISNATIASATHSEADKSKGFFSIGASPPRSKDDLRLSPKSTRKERSRVLRSKRERAVSPSTRDLTTTSARVHTGSSSRSSSRAGSLRKVHEAMSPSLAQCMRAVFAAFMWHEGIVHDAMACASFLKFHPNLPKHIATKVSSAERKQQGNADSGIGSLKKDSLSRGSSKRSTPTSTPSNSLQRHSRNSSASSMSFSDASNINITPSSTPSNSLKKHSRSDSGTSGVSVTSPMTNMNEAAKNSPVEQVKAQNPRQRTGSESKALPEKPSSLKDTKDTKEGGSDLPPTLEHLVNFWEELSESTLKVVQNNMILPSPTTAILTKLKKNERKEKENNKKEDKKSKKSKKDGKFVGLLGRGKVFLAQDGLDMDRPGGGGLLNDRNPMLRDTMCELCESMYPHPVTYHMKEAHPGCGSHAGGQGYNSGGNFCGGWAGNCGDGGIGGSTWYLMCERCREKYLKEKIQVQKVKLKKKLKKKSVTVKAGGNDSQTTEPHLVMKNNAMFLLDLASSAGFHIPGTSSQHSQQPIAVKRRSMRLDSSLPSVNEDFQYDANAFPAVPFTFLGLRGAQGADSAFAEDVLVSDGEAVGSPGPGGLSKSGHFDRRHNETSPIAHRSVSATVSDNTIKQTSPHHGHSRSAEASPIDGPQDKSPQGRILFKRSISEFTHGRANNAEDIKDGQDVNHLVPRRRNTSGASSDGGASLLKHPSKAMSKLIKSSEASGNEMGGDDLKRPVLAFVMQKHDLDSLQVAMRQALRKAMCRVYALQAFNWLLRSVTQPSCIHDLLWHFVGSLTPAPTDSAEEEEEDKDNKEAKKEAEPDKDKESLCEHPLEDIAIAGDAVSPLPQTFHSFLQTISDVMMYLPPGSALQQMAVRCWCLKFRPADHEFLHKCHVFSNISKILSKSDEGWGLNTIARERKQHGTKLESLKDLSAQSDIKASSRQAMVQSLKDNSTETFWESGDEDRNKTKSMTITCAAHHKPVLVAAHIDNSRDLGNKVGSVVFHTGPNAEQLEKIRQADVESRFTGWVLCRVGDPKHHNTIKLEMKGPDNNLRLRQIKVLGMIEGSSLALGPPPNALVMQQQNCETETLKVFRLLTSQVFGKLLFTGPGDEKQENMEGSFEDLDLREHMVGILFSRSKLTHLQKQVCAHIVQAIRKETLRVREEWEAALASDGAIMPDAIIEGDAYCFELLSMVLALSGSAVGRTYLAMQHNLMQDLLTLLHTASPRVQRQVTSLLRRVLPEVAPQVLANLLGVPALPPNDLGAMATSRSDRENAPAFDPRRMGILDVFLACIAKSLTVQMKLKGKGSSKGGPSTFKIGDTIDDKSDLGSRWWLRGTTTPKLANNMIELLKDLASGKLTDTWTVVAKGAIAENILALTRMDETLRVPEQCIKTPTLWLAIASLTVLNQEHVERLSSGHYMPGSAPSTSTTNLAPGDSSRPDGCEELSRPGAENPRPSCDNHDDGETMAIIHCDVCGNLCSDCDRFLHLSRKMRSHQRQVFKEEEEAIKVDLHEGCGRAKLFWIMCLADSKTHKAMVEFREGSKGSEGMGGSGVCRFCGSSGASPLPAVGNVCADPDCQENARMCCNKIHACGHTCGGIAEEAECLPCLHGCKNGASSPQLRQDADDMCMICFTEALAAAPAIQLKCGHVFHLRCCRNVLEKRWYGPRITFAFSQCPICKVPMEHSVLDSLLQPIRKLYDDVKRKATMRLEYEGLHKSEAIERQGARFHNDPAAFAMDRYAYYVCFKCEKAYYGGEARCEEQAGNVEEYDPSELVCGGCSDVSRAQMCPKHGTDFLEYKCRYCCSVAVFFCFGTTHFCNACHEDFQRVTNIPKSELPRCPAGAKARQMEGEECPLHVKHPPTGEEFALGCGVCRNAHTF